MATSTLNSHDFAARVRAGLDMDIPVQLVTRADANISLCIFGACERLGRAIKDTLDRNKLQKKITKAPAAGVIDLTHADFNGTFWDTLKRPGGIRLADSSIPAKHAPTFEFLQSKLPSDVLWYYILGKEIIFRNPSTGALNTYATSCIFTVSYIPVIDASDATRPLDDTLDDQLVSRGIEMVGKLLGGMQFLSADPDTAAEMVRGLPKD